MDIAKLLIIIKIGVNIKVYLNLNNALVNICVLKRLHESIHAYVFFQFVINLFKYYQLIAREAQL